MNRDRFEYWKAKDGWRWHRYRNGNVMYGSTEGYSRKRDAIRILFLSAGWRVSRADGVLRDPWDVRMPTQEFLRIYEVTSPSKSRRRARKR